MTIGLSTDAHDNIWIVHRPQTLEQKESYATRKEADCCTAAPDVLEFDPAGNLLRHWGRDEVKGNGHDWPSSNHGITIDRDGNVWLGGNGAYQPGPPPGSAAQFAPPPPGGTSAAVFHEGGGEQGVYHDSFILKFSPDGKFLGEIGKAQWQQGQPRYRECERRGADPLPAGDQRPGPGGRLWQSPGLDMGCGDPEIQAHVGRLRQAAPPT